MSLQKIALSALTLATAAFIGLAPAQAAKNEPALTKEQVQKIVHDYILDHPEVLMQSVENFQKKKIEERQANAAESLKKNKELLTASGSPEAGNPKGDVTMVEFFDYNCHYCKVAYPAVRDLMDKDKKVRVIFKELPILGPSSEEAAKWALAAYAQKKYLDFHAAMMQNKEPITDSLLAKVAKKVGMDVDKAKEYVTSPDVASELAKNRALADQLDVSGTPAFIIGDDISRGAIPVEAMEEKVNALRKAGKK
jgi:protein-disulfide isomerase